MEPKLIATCVICAAYPASGGGNLVLAYNGKSFLMAVCSEHMDVLASGVDTVMAEMAADPEDRLHAPSKGSGVFIITSLEGEAERRSRMICGHCFPTFCLRVMVLVAQLNPERVPRELVSFFRTLNEGEHHGSESHKDRKQPST